MSNWKISIIMALVILYPGNAWPVTESIFYSEKSKTYDEGISVNIPTEKEASILEALNSSTKAGASASKRKAGKIASVIEFFNTSIESGELNGRGTTPIASEGKLNAFKSLLKTAEILLDIRDIDGACQQLGSAYKKSDGEATNNDYIAGPAAPKMNQILKSLMKDLGCK